MNAQERMIDKRTFRIAATALAAAAVLVLAAYLFSASLRADTSASVVPSALGADSAAARAASLAALAKSRSDFYADLNNSAASARSASLAALAKSRSDFYADLNNSAAAVKAASLAALAKSRSDFYADLNNSGAAAAAPAMTLGASHYARLGSLTAAEAASLGNIAPATVDAYQNEWMGFTAPESMGASSSAADQYQRSKPEGIRPAAESGADQLQSIKPEGIKAFGTK